MKQLILFCMLLVSMNTNGQKYGNIWHFGDSAAIDFNGCAPVALTNSVMNGFEGTASVCDDNGQILFYTNSDKVWNDFNSPMPNGNLITSSGTISQVLIVPAPGSDSLYYIITTKVQAAGNLSLQYHVVDVTQNAGHGDVISKNNIMTPMNVTEQVCATWHGNGTDIWIVAHEYGTNAFLSFLLTASGMTPWPIISTTGPSHVACTSNMNARGEIKFSPNGHKIAFNGNGVGNNFQTNILCLLDFDNLTGQVLNPINMPCAGGEFGLSFSEDNSKLYGSTWKAFNFPAGSYNYLYQFDITSNDSTLIANSRYVVDSIISSPPYGSLKLAPDGKIYLARNNSLYLGVINNPNLPGLACNYQATGFYLGGKKSGYGLNNYIEYIDYCTPTALPETASATIVTLQPNPAADFCDLVFPFESGREYRFYVYDATGRKVVEAGPLTTGTFRIETGAFPAGVYFYRLNGDGACLGSGTLLHE